MFYPIVAGDGNSDKIKVNEEEKVIQSYFKGVDTHSDIVKIYSIIECGESIFLCNMSQNCFRNLFLVFLKKWTKGKGIRHTKINESTQLTSHVTMHHLFCNVYEKESYFL